MGYVDNRTRIISKTCFHHINGVKYQKMVDSICFGEIFQRLGNVLSTFEKLVTILKRGAKEEAEAQK